MRELHPRVVNVRTAEPGTYVYVGRGSGNRASLWGNPFSIYDHGPRCMVFFLDWLAGIAPTGPRFDAPRWRGGFAARGLEVANAARKVLVGQVLGCHCAGCYPVCHAEVYARLADGEELAAIRADVLGRIGLA